MTTGEAAPRGGTPSVHRRAPQFRYFAVLWLVALAVVFLIAAPTADWSRAVGLALLGSALVTTVATSRASESVRERLALSIAVLTIAAILLIAFGLAPRWFVSLAGVSITTAIPIALGRGLLRLLRERGVTLQAVAGSLAIYLSVGMIFAWIVAFLSQITNTPYFAQHTDGTQGEKIYFSFSVLTTTGFGDYTPATPAGHAFAVIEMLTGQLYLVTVIGLLIGNFAGRRQAS